MDAPQTRSNCNRLARHWSRVLLLLAITGLLTACGGGGGGAQATCGGSAGFLTDSGIHPPPTTGVYAYNTFMLDAPCFPRVGGIYTDPIFGGAVKRLTNMTGQVNQEDIYSKHQANADGTLAFHRTAAEVDIINVNTGATVYSSVPVGLEAFEMHWDALDPDKYYFFSGANLMRRNLAAQTNTTMATFPSTLEVNGGSVNIQSRDGRYFTVRYGGTNQVWDSQTNTIYSGSVTPLSAGGWVGISPDGNYIVNMAGSAAAPQEQHYSYPINHGTQSIGSTPTQFWGLCGAHGDIISASNGKSYYVGLNCYSGAPGLYRVDLTLNQAGRTYQQQLADNQLLLPITWNDDVHVSSVSKGAFSDWVFVSTESTVDNFNSGVASWTAYEQEIIAINVMTLEVRRLAHHRSRQLAAAYGTQPKVSSSWDGSVVMWVSNFNVSSPTGYADLYAIQSSLGP